MAVKIGSARIDERGYASGGQAGDQTGREVCTENWYLSNQGWYVIRAKSDTAREKIAQDMEYACANNNIGYDQSQNQTLWNVASKVGYNCSKVTTKCETDCARLVRVCVWYAGIHAGDFYTGNEVSVLKSTGAFDILTDSKYCSSSAYLKRGDILVTRTKGHTVVVLSNGSKIASPVKPSTPSSNTSSSVVFTYAVKAGGKILPAVTNLNDYAGIRGKAITDIAIKVNKGSLKYRVHIKGGSWLPYVTGYNWKDANNGYAGDGKPIDAVQVILSGVSGQVAQYRVSPVNRSYYAWQYNNQTTNGQDGYAGAYGKTIDRFQVY